MILCFKGGNACEWHAATISVANWTSLVFWRIRATLGFVKIGAACPEETARSAHRNRRALSTRILIIEA
jgi:hypothetical protein